MKSEPLHFRKVIKMTGLMLGAIHYQCRPYPSPHLIDKPVELDLHRDHRFA